MTQSPSPSPSPQRLDGATLAFLAALGLSPASKRGMWRAARRAFLDRFDPDAHMPVGTAMMRDHDGSLIEVDLAEYRASALFRRAMDHAQHHMCLAQMARRRAFLVAPYVGDDIDHALHLAEEREAWHDAFTNLPGWVQRRYGTAEASNPFERARINAGPLSAKAVAEFATLRHIMRDEIAARAAFGRRVTELAGLDPARRRIVGQRLQAQAKAERQVAGL